jgi:hypothetical protein
LAKKKWLALALILVMALGLVGGCSPTENNFYTLLMEISNQKVYTDRGSIQITLNQLPTSAMAAGDGAFDQAVLMKGLNQHRIDYAGKVDLSKNVMEYQFTIVDTVSGQSSPVLTVRAKGDMFYFKIDGLIDYLGQLCTPAEQLQLDKTMGDVVWVSLSEKELNAMMPPGSETLFSGDMFQRSSTQRAVWQRLFDGLVNDAYKDYQSGLITQAGNRYTLNLRGADLMNFVKPAAIYTINHIDAVGTNLKKFLDGLSPEELASLGFTASARTEMSKGIDAMVQDVNQNRAQYLSELENMSNMASQEMVQTFNDSQLTTAVEKTGPVNYQQDTRLHIHISSGSPADTMEFTFNQEHNMQTGATVVVAVPSGPVMTYTELTRKMPNRIKVNVDTGSYYSNHGFMSSSGAMEVHLVNNYTYLPLRMIGESLGAEIGWDQNAFQAYALQNGQRVYMTSQYFNNRAFIKIRDFEQLGYTVEWDAATRNAIISK